MRFIGSKKTVLPAIHDVLHKRGLQVDGLVFVDAFAGTGAVGSDMRSLGATVIGNDLLFFSYLRQIALLSLSSPPAFEGVEEFDGIGSARKFLLGIPGQQGIISKTFGADGEDRLNYFSDRVARWADGVLSFLRRQFRTGRLSWTEYAVLISEIIETLDHAANTTGVYAACLKTPPRVKEIAEIKPVLEISGPAGFAANTDAINLVAGVDADIVYVDSPYNTRQYSSYYHIPEIIARLPLCEPEAFRESLVNTTKMLPYRLKSKFSTKRGVEEAFLNLFRACTAPAILVSYSEDGIIPIDDLVICMERFYGNVYKHAVQHAKYKSSDLCKERKVKEYLIFGIDMARYED